MGKRINQSGFTAIEILLALIFIAIIAFIGVYIVHNHSNKTAPTNTVRATSPKVHSAAEATTFVQKTYDDFLAAINNAGPDNTQPLGLVGLAAVKDNLSAGFYTKAATSHNAGDFSCAAQFLPNKYTASLASSDTTNAVVSLTIANSTDGLSNTGGMTATVNLTSLKITAVSCPS